MGLSRLSAVCRACPLLDRCKNKRMEEVGELPWPPLIATASQPDAVTIPVMAEHDYREINIGDGMEMAIDMADIGKFLEDQLYQQVFCDRFFRSAT